MTNWRDIPTIQYEPPVVETVNGFDVVRVPGLRWEDSDNHRSRKGYVHHHAKWGLFDGDELVCYCCYKKGAVELAKWLGRKGVKGKAMKKKGSCT